MKLLLFTDGGSRNNPGPAGIGGVGYDKKGAEVFRFKKFLGQKTNNQAEYMALLEGLALAYNKGFKEIASFMDSELVVKQLNGFYKIKHPELKSLVSEVLKLKNQFSQITFKHITREKNKFADRLVNEAIDESL